MQFLQRSILKTQRNFRFRLWHVAGVGFGGVGLGLAEICNIQKKFPHIHQSSSEGLLSVPIARDIAILSPRYPILRDTFSGRISSSPKLQNWRRRGKGEETNMGAFFEGRCPQLGVLTSRRRKERTTHSCASRCGNSGDSWPAILGIARFFFAIRDSMPLSSLLPLSTPSPSKAF